ncbi:hypothetical protein FLL45_01680 [Aliikangiella marina]|uniref:Uncharacterized protein n=1 Tax=Aliikangiella marina TaxID=1712262 RepID=A0A545THM8_9GAMM|nr:hypothetical protein [Aliikangiella marina]TQV76696.1 hypothetical protein FLL45_01680 [Aliikangiella marina]
MTNLIKIIALIVYVGSLNTATAEELILKTYKAEWTLFEVHDECKGGGCFGRYRHYHDMTGGRFIDLFPDYKFIVIDFCDICENEAVGHGTYEIKGSKIIFNYKVEPENKLPDMHVRWGWQDKGSYVTGHIKVLLSDEQLSELIKEPESSDYIYQLRRYYEWRKVQGELMQKLKKTKLSKDILPELEEGEKF